jgi:hypothetical protein
MPDTKNQTEPVQAPVAAKAPKDKSGPQPESDAAPSAVPGEVENLDESDEDQVNPILKSFGKILYWTGVVTALAIAAVGLLILAVAKDTGYELVFLIAAAVAYMIGRACLYFLAHE